MWRLPVVPEASAVRSSNSCLRPGQVPWWRLTGAEASLQVLQRRTQSDKRVHCVLLDVRSTAALTATLKAHGITDVVHTAAHKHVPIVEANPVEGVRNNVFGTKAVVDAAAAAKVSRLVFCSTDKAVDPVGVMGMTKRLGEALVLDSAAGGAALGTSASGAAASGNSARQVAQYARISD